MSWNPTLSSIEQRPDRPWDRPRPVTQQAREEDALAVVGCRDRCYCGEPFPHGWPGQGDGVPHPAVVR